MYYVSPLQDKTTDLKNNSWSVNLYPQDGFPFGCYPYCKKTDKYASPLVMAQFQRLPESKVFDILCTAYANNIQLDRKDRAGMVRFSMKILSWEVSVGNVL